MFSFFFTTLLLNFQGVEDVLLILGPLESTSGLTENRNVQKGIMINRKLKLDLRDWTKTGRKD